MSSAVLSLSGALERYTATDGRDPNAEVRLANVLYCTLPGLLPDRTRVLRHVFAVALPVVLSQACTRTDRGPSSLRRVGPTSQLSFRALAEMEPDGFLAATDEGLARSSDGGRTWRLINDYYPLLVDQLVRTSQTTLFAIARDASHPETGIAHVGSTHDAGHSWSWFRLDAVVELVSVDGMAPLALTGDGHLWQASDDAANWKEHGTAIPLQAGATVGGAAGCDGTIYVSSSDGIYRSHDTAKTWQHSITLAGTEESIHPPGLASAGEHVWAIVQQPPRLYHTRCGSDSWKPVLHTLQESPLCCWIAHRSGLYVGTEQEQALVIHLVLNSTKQSRELPSPPENMSHGGLIVRATGELLLFGDGIFALSAGHWTRIDRR